MNKPTVTVIIPSLNGARWIGKAIKSILMQSYPAFEIFVVDGGSRDNTESIVKAYKDRIQFISRPGLNLAATRNAGISLAKGDLICFLDVDDEWMDSKLEKEIDEFNNYPKTGLIYSNCCIINENSEIIGQLTPPELSVKNFKKKLFISNFIPNPTVMVPRYCYEKVGFFDEKMQYCEDYEMWMRLAASYQFSYIPEFLAKWRIHGSNMSKRKEHWDYEMILTDKFIALHPELKPWRHHREARIYRGYGNYFYLNHDILKARSFFKNSIKNQPMSIKCYFQYFKSFLPSQWLLLYRKLKEYFYLIKINYWFLLL